MRIAVHDYAGYAFPVELSRELARRGHDVLHLYSSAITSPRGRVSSLRDDPATFAVEPVNLGVKIDRDKLFERRRLEAEHGRRVVARSKAFCPDVVLSSNAPLESQKQIYSFCKRDRIGFVYWVQDLIGEAATRLLRQRSAVARPVAWYYRQLEHRLLWSADGVVVISADFRPYVPSSAAVIENWAPLRDLPLRPKRNPWSEANGLAATTNLLYSGTLGMKHNPEILLRLASASAHDANLRVVVASEGSAANWIRQQRDLRGMNNIVLLPFQPFEDLADMYASADVLIAILEPAASVFSVPSKVLSYLCAGRPLLLVVPPENLAARIVRESGAGIVVPPTDTRGTEQALASLVSDPVARAEMGARARGYAERTFDLATIADRFENVLNRARVGEGRRLG